MQVRVTRTDKTLETQGWAQTPMLYVTLVGTLDGKWFNLYRLYPFGAMRKLLHDSSTAVGFSTFCPTYRSLHAMNDPLMPHA